MLTGYKKKILIKFAFSYPKKKTRRTSGP